MNMPMTENINTEMDEKTRYEYTTAPQGEIVGYIPSPYVDNFNILFGNEDVSKCRYFSFKSYNEIYDKRNSKKQVFIGWECNNECNSDGYSCYYIDMNAKFYFDGLCPYANVKMINEPNKTASLHNDWEQLKMKFTYRLIFGRFAKWAFENKEKLEKANPFPLELYKRMKKYPEFSLENITRSHSLEYHKNMVEKDKDYLDYRNIRPFTFDIPWLRSFVHMYLQEIDQFRDGVCLRCFNTKEENLYLKWKEKTTINIIKVGDYFVINENCFYNYWREQFPEFLRSKNISNNAEGMSTNFHRKDIEKVIQFFMANQTCATSKYVPRRIVEMLEDYLRNEDGYHNGNQKYGVVTIGN